MSCGILDATHVFGPAEMLAEILSDHPGFVVARPIVPMQRRGTTRRKDRRTVSVIAGETTRLHGDRDRERIMTLAAQHAFIDPAGEIVEVGAPHVWFDGSRASTPSRTGRSMNSQDEVRAHHLTEGEIYGLMSSADLLVCHGSTSLRCAVEDRFGRMGKTWICSMEDLDWRACGFDSRRLPDLLLRCGWSYAGGPPHAEVNALLHLLDHRLEGGPTVLEALLRSERPAMVAMEPVATPLHAGDLLEERGYRWNADKERWARAVRGDELEAERAWLAERREAACSEPR